MAQTGDAFERGLRVSDNGRLVFSSDEFDERLDNKARMSRWFDIYNVTFGEADIHWDGEGVYRARSEFVPLGDAITAIDFMFHRIARNKRQISRDNHEQLAIGFMEGARVRAKIGNNELSAPASSIYLYSTAQPIEFLTDAGASPSHRPAPLRRQSKSISPPSAPTSR